MKSRAKKGSRRGRPLGSPAGRRAKWGKPAQQLKSAKRIPSPQPRRQKPTFKPVQPPPRHVADVLTKAQQSEKKKQQKLYEDAMRLFQAREFQKADGLLQKVIQGPDRSLALRAQVHSQICRTRTHPQTIVLRTAEDHYNYAIALINYRRLKEASQELETALAMEPSADHIHYALAATYSLLGNPQGACERLRSAISLQPRNRFLARGDADFAAILEYPPLALLLHLDRGPSKTR